MSDFLTAFDVILCLLIMLAAVDVLRRSYFPKDPVKCLSCYLVSIGALGVILFRSEGGVPTGWTVAMHLGMVVYLFADWRAIFLDTWAWFGHDRRKKDSN